MFVPDMYSRTRDPIGNTRAGGARVQFVTSQRADEFQDRKLTCFPSVRKNPHSVFKSMHLNCPTPERLHIFYRSVTPVLRESDGVRTRAALTVTVTLCRVTSSHNANGKTPPNTLRLQKKIFQCDNTSCRVSLRCTFGACNSFSF